MRMEYAQNVVIGKNNPRKAAYKIHNESEETMLELSEWEEEPGPGFVIIEEDKNNPKDDDSWGAKENGFFDNGDDFFRD